MSTQFIYSPIIQIDVSHLMQIEPEYSSVIVTVTNTISWNQELEIQTKIIKLRHPIGLQAKLFSQTFLSGERIMSHVIHSREINNAKNRKRCVRIWESTYGLCWGSSQKLIARKINGMIEREKEMHIQFSLKNRNHMTCFLRILCWYLGRNKFLVAIMR